MDRRLPLLAVFCALLASCDAAEKNGSSGATQPAPNPSQESATREPGDIKPIDLPRPAEGQIVVAAYNVKNFLRMERWVDGQQVADLPKPDDEVAAMVRVIADIDPDVLLLSEMGGPGDFGEFRGLLAGAGLDYQHAEHHQAADDVRHLALLSRFPIVSRDSVARLEYRIGGAREYMQRGILDATLQVTPDYQLRVLGAHLKSKRPVPQGEALMRRNEAHLLRRHIDAILERDPQTNLLLGGDLNDTKNEPPIQEIMGSRGSPGHMADIWLRDALGDRWTYFWGAADIYSRIDYMMVSRALFREVDKEKSYVYRSPFVMDASDHRPVVVVITPKNL